MNIGIIGSGNMGRSLGILWAEQGHEVFFGARTTEKGREVAAIAGRKTQGGSNDEAAGFGTVLLYTVRGVNPAEVFSSISVLDDKILIDCNNQEIPENFEYPAITRSLAAELAPIRVNVIAPGVVETGVWSNQSESQQSGLAKWAEESLPVQHLGQAGCQPSQLAIAWVLAQGEHIVPIPGTKRRSYLEENLGALLLKLSQEELARINEVAPQGSFVGASRS